MKQSRSGFTIVELLIVIVVIAILAAISIVAYNGVQQRARDTVRKNDLTQIKQALLMYNVNNGGVPGTPTYGGNGQGGWDISSSPNWLKFLSPSIYGKIPVDPVNLGTSDPLISYQLTYFYYCYAAGGGPLPATPNVQLGYWSEVSKTRVTSPFAVDACL